MARAHATLNCTIQMGREIFDGSAVSHLVFFNRANSI